MHTKVVPTSTRTRERLVAAEAELARKSMATSTATREKLKLAEDKLKGLETRTSTKTREKLVDIEAKIKLKNKEMTSERGASIIATLTGLWSVLPSVDKLYRNFKNLWFKKFKGYF